MPPLSNNAHPHPAVTRQIAPVLEEIVANDNLCSLRIPDGSSKEFDKPRDDEMVLPLGRREPIAERIKAIMDRPIDDDELNIISHIIAKDLLPREIYCREAIREVKRVQKYISRPKPPVLKGRKGIRRRAVIVRHNIKRRWQKLGVWNSQWDYAGHKRQPNNFHRWTWGPQCEGPSNQMKCEYDEAAELAVRALRLRQNVRRGERAPVTSLSHSGQEMTTAQKEDFLISRPWFTSQLEVAEEQARLQRLPLEDQHRCPYSPKSQVLKWWEERGDWGNGPRGVPACTSWKWRHESPSPEPEDLTPLRGVQDSLLGVAEEMNFTPSEVDELEMIDLPESEQPEGDADYPLSQYRVGEGRDRDQLLSPQCSARISSMKLPVEPLSSQATSDRILGSIEVATDSSTITVQPLIRKVRHKTPRHETEARPRRGRGRPRKDAAPIMRSVLLAKESARAAASTGASAQGVRRRGRPRKNT